MVATARETGTNSSDVLPYASFLPGPAETYIHKLCGDTVCHLEDLPSAMVMWNEWRKRKSKEFVLLGHFNDGDDDDGKE